MDIIKYLTVVFCVVVVSPAQGLSIAQVEQGQSPSEFTFYGAALGRELYQFKYDSETGSVEKVEIPFCQTLGLEGSDCGFRVTSGYGNTVLVASDSAIYVLDKDATGIWQTQTIDFTSVTTGVVWGVSHLGVHEGVAISVLLFKDGEDYKTFLVSMVRGVNELWSVARYEVVSDLFEYAVVQEIVFYGDRFVLTNTRDSKFRVYDFAQDGSFSGGTSLTPDYEPQGIFPAQLIAHDLYESSMVVGGNSGFGAEPGEAFMYNLNERNQWQLTQQLDMPEGEYFSFGQQVYLGKDTAVVVSLRSSTEYEYEPNYHIFQRATNNSWQLTETIEHTGNYKLNCLDCIFAGKIRWQAYLQEPNLFLPIVNDDGNRDGFRYMTYDLTLSTDLAPTSDTSSDSSVALLASDAGGGTLDRFSLSVFLFLLIVRRKVCMACGRIRSRDKLLIFDYSRS